MQAGCRRRLPAPYLVASASSCCSYDSSETAYMLKGRVIVTPDGEACPCRCAVLCCAVLCCAVLCCALL
mgnify:CR=1 FL=1